MSSKLALIAGLLLVNVAVRAAPQDKLIFSAGLSYENSDNVNLSPTNKLSENIIHTLLSTDYQRQSGRLQASFNLNADYQKYQNRTFNNQTVISSSLSLNATLAKQRLFWIVDNSLERVQRNQAQANIPSNQENVNHFTTGPKFIFFKNNKDSLDADIKYEKFYTEVSNDDYTGYIANASYLRNITHTATVGMRVTYNNRKFDDQLLNADYTRTDVIFNIAKKMKRSSLELDAGKTWLNLKSSPNTEEGIFIARYQRQLDKQTSLNASFTRELTDFSNVFAANQSGGITNTDVSSAIFVRKSGQLSVSRNFSKSNLQYNYNYTNNDYNDNTLDTIVRDSSLRLRNQINAGLTMDLGALYRDTSYSGGNRVDLTRIYNLGVTQKFLDSYDLSFGIQYTSNGSTDSNFSYDERRIILSGHYYFR